MKMISTLVITILLISISQSSFSQSNFSIDAYKQFLQANQNMNPDQLLQMHPAGNFVGDLNLSITNSRYLDSISFKYGLTSHELDMLGQNGFVVSERMKKISFGESFLEIFHKDLPVFVSTDAILHAFHISYDRILKDAEAGMLIESVKSLLQTMHSQQNALNTKYGNNPEMLTMLKDVDLYLTVPLKLFELNVNPYYTENNQRVSEILNEIEAEEMDTCYLFSTNCRSVDWSQFKPRGIS